MACRLPVVVVAPRAPPTGLPGAEHTGGWRLQRGIRQSGNEPPAGHRLSLPATQECGRCLGYQDRADTVMDEQTRAGTKQTMCSVEIGATTPHRVARQAQYHPHQDGAVTNLGEFTLMSQNSGPPRAAVVEDYREIFPEGGLHSTVKVVQFKPSLSAVPLALVAVVRI